MHKLMYLTIILIISLYISTNVAAQGLELYGRVYDGNAKYNSINDADLEIIISGMEPNVEYPKGNNGEYRAIEFNVPSEKNVEIQAYHSEFMQSKDIKFRTTTFKMKKDIRMIRKNAFAEATFLKAKKINQNSNQNIDEAFSLGELSAEIAPRSRYYLFLADIIGNRIKSMPENGELPSNMASFISSIPDDKAFISFSDDKKKEFYTKIGYYFSKSRNLSCKPAGLKTCLQYSIDAYDKAINLSPDEVTPYQGKYLVLRKSNNFLDAIAVIDKYFNTNDPVTSELTIKGLLVDWVDLVRSHTGFKGSEQEIESHKSDEHYKKLWAALYKWLEQYKSYYQNTSITGNKNLQDAYAISKRISSNE